MPHSNLGMALVGMGALHEGLTHFRKAVEIKPDNAAFQRNLAAALPESDRLDEAI